MVSVLESRELTRRLGDIRKHDSPNNWDDLRWGCCVEVLAPSVLANIEKEIEARIGKPRYDLWFLGNTQLKYQDGTLQIGVPNRFYREWLESHFEVEIRQAAKEVYGGEPKVRFRIEPTLFRRAPAAEMPIKQSNVHSTLIEPPPTAPRPSRSRFSLSRFVIGPANRIAYTAAMSVIENPRNGFNPLFVYGAVGLGKTHLFRGIEEELRNRHHSLKMLALSGEEFVNQFMDSVRSGRVNAFRKQFRQLDFLLLDGVQFLCSRRGSQEEFFHTYNSLDVRGSKILLTADTHPRQLPSLREELRTRFLAGMVARLDAPNHEMRCQIVRNKAAERLIELPADVVAWMADHSLASIGELEGALNTLQHYCETVGVAMTLAAAKAALAEILRHSAPTIQIAEVKRKACDLFGIRLASLNERTRSRAVCHPRMLVMYLARKYTHATYSEIGTQLGGLNHSTVIAAEKRIAAGLAKDREIDLGDRRWRIRDAIESFEREIGRR